MEFFLDTANMDEIRDTASNRILVGVNKNPTPADYGGPMLTLEIRKGIVLIRVTVLIQICSLHHLTMTKLVVQEIILAEPYVI